MWSFLFFALGSVVGSFLNVVIYRLPRGESILSPRSHCPQCGKSIRWYDNIPILSFIILGGRCRDCKKNISVQYPTIELLTAGSITFNYLRFGLTFDFLIYASFLCLLITISAIDLHHKLIPDRLSLGGVSIGIAGSLVIKNMNILDSIKGILVGFISLYIIAIFGRVIFKKEAMGGGDVKLLAMIGAFTGWEGAIVALFTASIIGSITGILLRLLRREKVEFIPFGPFLAVGALISLYWKEALIKLFVGI